MQNAHRKVPVFQVNIPWGEPQSYSWSIGYMSTSFRFIYSPRKIPGKRPTKSYLYITYYMPCVLFAPSIVSVHHPRVTGTLLEASYQWLKVSTIHVCAQNQFNQTHKCCLCQLNQPHNRRLSKSLQENTYMHYQYLIFQVRKYSSCRLKRPSFGVLSYHTAS